MTPEPASPQPKARVPHRKARLALLGWVLALLFAWVPRSAQAANEYDPELDYFTLKTPRFLIMFPRGYEHIALRAGTIAERTLPHITQRYGWEPDGRISLIINDQTDFANGSATIIPSKVVTIYVTAPTEVSGLEDYDDWLSAVITHELAHIVHLDMAFGLPWLGRLIFGKYVAMNQYTPAWVTEGLAVYEETLSSGAGRGRSSYVEMVMRMAALSGNFPGIDRGYRGYPSWPFSNVAYFLGGRFQLWLAERYGEPALLRYHRAYAANPIPYFTWLPATIAFDASMESLWDAFRADMEEDARATLEAVKTSTPGLTQPTRLTRYGGDLLGPRVTPDGQSIVFSTYSPVDGPRVRKISLDGTKDEVLVNDTFSKEISFTPDGSAFYFQQTEINQRFYSHNSILRYDLAKDEFSRIALDPADDHTENFLAPSGSLRARDPDISPDGRRIVFVQTPYGANRLVLAWLESNGTTIHPKEIVPAEPDVQLSNPRFSPDGRLISASRFKGGRRDIVLYDLTGKLVLELTRDRAQDIDATWSPDGRWLVFSSDRTGIYNLYAWDLEKEELRRLTNLIDGAYQPCVSPDGTRLIYRGYSAEGFDVYALPFEPERAPRVALERLPPVAFDETPRRWPPEHETSPEIPPPAPFTGTPLPETLPKDWSLDSYSAADTILPFHDNWNLFPTLFANESEVFASLSHFGADALQTQSYAVQVNYGTRTNFVGGSVGYRYDRLEPTFSLFGAATGVNHPGELIVAQSPTAGCAFGDEPLDLEGRRYCFGSNNGDYHERRLSGQFSIGLPVLQRHLFSVSYIFEHRGPLEALPANTVESVLPRRGRFARVQLGYRYANVRAFPHSISLERGQSFSVALSGLSRGLGSEYEEIVLTSEGRLYVSMPWRAEWLRNHVLATRLSLGVSGGPDLAETFRLGGVAGSSAITTTTDNYHGLRGIRTSALRGTSTINGAIEYRAPIVRLDRGPGTLPLTGQVLHLAFFADWGRVFEDVSADGAFDHVLDEVAVGVGAELRAGVTLFYGLPLTLIVGFALPAKLPESSPNIGSTGAYFQIGATF